MDAGEVIPGLNEDWTFAGSKLFEWLGGLMAAFLVASFLNRPAHYMPFLVLIWIGTTLSLSSFRKQFPDEERGIRNACMAGCGFEPPGIPPPARMQPIWSGAPTKTKKHNCLFDQLELDEVLKIVHDPNNPR